MYESHRHRPLPRRHFYWRMLFHFVAAQSLVLVSLLIGMAGYIYYEKLVPYDAFLNAAMLLSGMGPVQVPVTNGGKLFAGLYALYAGLIFLIVAGVLLVPVLHRLMHQFHWSGDRWQ